MEQATKNKIKKFVDAVCPIATKLWMRWQDEKEYEDINDYKPPIELVAKDCDDIHITRMTKQPFGFEFSCQTIKLKFSITSTGNLTVKLI